jgi:hypothetical protein
MEPVSFDHFPFRKGVKTRMSRHLGQLSHQRHTQHFPDMAAPHFGH